MDLKVIAEYVNDIYNKKESMDPIVEKYPELTIDQAYEIQIMNAKKQAEHDEISGMKIGLTSKAMQDMLNVNEPDFGHIYKSREIVENTISVREFANPKIEAEIAFVMKKDLEGTDITKETLIDAVDYVMASFEIADSRTRDWKFSIRDAIVDNASFGSYKLGSIKKKLSEIDLENEKMILKKNDNIEGEGSGKDCYGSPLIALEWLVDCMHKYGLSLKTGDIVLSGALSKAIEVKAGDVIRAEFSSLGNLELEFVE